MLLTLSIALWAGWLIGKLAPDTLLGRACRAWLVERPAAWTESLTLGRAVSLVVSGAVLAVAVVYLAPIISGEAALMLAGDALAYFEILAAVVLVTIRSGRASWMVRRKVGHGHASLMVLAASRGLPRPRAPRLSRKRSRISPSADEPELAFALA